MLNVIILFTLIFVFNTKKHEETQQQKTITTTTETTLTFVDAVSIRAKPNIVTGNCKMPQLTIPTRKPHTQLVACLLCLSNNMIRICFILTKNIKKHKQK